VPVTRPQPAGRHTSEAIVTSGRVAVRREKNRRGRGIPAVEGATVDFGLCVMVCPPVICQWRAARCRIWASRATYQGAGRPPVQVSSCR
jgi:hypothetical protein